MLNNTKALAAYDTALTLSPAPTMAAWELIAQDLEAELSCRIRLGSSPSIAPKYWDRIADCRSRVVEV